jgi:hypothetical protein
MEKRWIKAATILQPSIEVCGVRLLKFSLRHRVALEAIDSPVLRVNAPMTASHLVAAVKILSSKTIEEIATPATFKQKFWVSRMEFNRSLLVTEMAKLIQYLDAQATWPRFWHDEDNKNAKADNGIPWQLAVVASLVRNGCTTEEAWTMPEAEAIWLHMANCAYQGSEVKIISDEEWDAMMKYKQSIKQETNQN